MTQQHTKERLKAARAAANQTRETLDRCAPRDPVVDETLKRTCRLTAGEGEASC